MELVREKTILLLYSGETVTNVLIQHKQIVYSDNNREVAYDQLIFATGSVPFILPIPGADKKGVTAFRNIEDCEKMIEYSKEYKKAAVIGGGLLGLEAARGLLNLGMEVDVIHLSRLFDGKTVGSNMPRKLLQKELEKPRDELFIKKTNGRKLLGENGVEGLRFSDGDEIKADLVVMAVGIKTEYSTCHIKWDSCKSRNYCERLYGNGYSECVCSWGMC